MDFDCSHDLFVRSKFSSSIPFSIMIIAQHVKRASSWLPPVFLFIFVNCKTFGIHILAIKIFTQWPFLAFLNKGWSIETVLMLAFACILLSASLLRSSSASSLFTTGLIWLWKLRKLSHLANYQHVIFWLKSQIPLPVQPDSDWALQATRFNFRECMGIFWERD